MMRPVKAVEIMARANAINRRSHGHVSGSIQIGDIVAYFDGRDPEVNGQRMNLTQREHAIFSHLVLHAGRVTSKANIYDAVYSSSDNEPFDKVIDVYICKIRRKIEGLTGQKYIETVYGRGYMLSAPESKADSVEVVAAQMQEGNEAANFVGA